MGAHEIDLAGAPEEVAAAQPGHDAAGAVVDDDNRNLRLVVHLAALVGHELAQGRLKLGADRGRNDRARRLAGEPGGEMRRVHRHRQPAGQDWPAGRHVVQGTVDHAVLERTLQHAVAAGLRRDR